jgi:tetratricopeptide (TPR) repeat protein
MHTEEQARELVEKAISQAFKKFQNKEFGVAEIILLQVLKINPESIGALHLLGMIHHESKNYNKAIDFFKKVVFIEPNNYENLNNLSLSYSEKGQFEDSIECLKKAIKIKPKCAFLYSNLGLQYKQIENYKNAIKYLKKSLEIEETEIGWSMLGGCYGEQQFLEEAEKCFLKALEIKKDFAPAHVDLSNVYLTRGDFDNAWKEYEYRYEVFEQLKVWCDLYDEKKRWKGQSLENKTIILHAEQGSGDTIQFARYISLLKNCRTIIHCSKNLCPIFKNIVDEFFTKEPTETKREELPDHDYQCSIISLPFILGIKEVPKTNIKINEKFDLSKYDDFFKIGISWAGNPQHPNDARRSLYLKNFQKIHDLPKVKLFSLVKDTRQRIYRFMDDPIDLTKGSEEMKIVDLSSEINDFYDTAKIINSLDLIISVDTSVLHLAGSLEKESWALLPKNCDWRWGQKGKKTEWYPSIKIFRQNKSKDWETVFNNVYKELKKRTNN